MAAGPSALLFDLGEVGALVPVGFGVVVVGECVEAWGFGGAAGDDGVRHAHDGGRIHAPAQLGEHGAVRAEPAADGFTEDGAEVLFIFGVSTVTDTLARIEIPILVNGMFPR